MRLKINELEYLEMPGLDVMLAHDTYPEGHQGGVGVIQNGLRVATNGDLRLEPTPGQWSPIPVVGSRIVDRKADRISVRMEYPDESKDKKGFNPIDYPDLRFGYFVRIQPVDEGFRIIVDLDEPVSPEWADKIGFNLELFPNYLVGKTFASGGEFGIFPAQSNGPGHFDREGYYQIDPLASGRRIVIAPESDRQRLTVESVSGGEIQLIDGRGRHDNGWFVLRSLVAPGRTTEAIEWFVKPHAMPDWRYETVIQVSQVGYHPDQKKVAVIEMDPRSTRLNEVSLLRISEDGGFETVLAKTPSDWGEFLRYRYAQFDFSEYRQPGMYIVQAGTVQTNPFKVGTSVYSRHVWQPTVDTFLPVQMCHMRINDNYRVWHGACHLDDALMAPIDFNHFDGYIQGALTLCDYSPEQHVPGLNRGGWHDAGDYDLRVESQAETVYGLALAYEEFQLDYDNTTVDQASRTVELNRPDGKADVLQQIEHGVLSILGGYRSLGRLYRGIIEPTLRQYTHLGDAATVTDNLVGTGDDRWVFTEDNPRRELSVAASLAAAARALREYDPKLSDECRSVAEQLYDRTIEERPLDRLSVAVELLLTTENPRFSEFIFAIKDHICGNLEETGWLIVRVLGTIGDSTLDDLVGQSLGGLCERIDRLARRTPYGIPYEPHIWGAGWGIQRFGFKQYWLYSRCPNIFSIDPMLAALSFVLGCHPGSNTASFVSGVGAKSMIPGYGVNRADNSYIPGGVGSGTALIRPNFPEFLEWPYLWQQTEYCVGSSTTDFVFLAAAADHLLSQSG